MQNNKYVGLRFVFRKLYLECENIGREQKSRGAASEPSLTRLAQQLNLVQKEIRNDVLKRALRREECRQPLLKDSELAGMVAQRYGTLLTKERVRL